MRENTCDGIVACAWLGERWATRAARIEIADRDRGWRYDIQRVGSDRERVVRGGYDVRPRVRGCVIGEMHARWDF